MDIPFALEQLPLTTVEDIKQVDVDERLRVEHRGRIHQERA